MAAGIEFYDENGKIKNWFTTNYPVKVGTGNIVISEGASSGSTVVTPNIPLPTGSQISVIKHSNASSAEVRSVHRSDGKVSISVYPYRTDLESGTEFGNPSLSAGTYTVFIFALIP